MDNIRGAIRRIMLRIHVSEHILCHLLSTILAVASSASHLMWSWQVLDRNPESTNYITRWRHHHGNLGVGNWKYPSFKSLPSKTMCMHFLILLEYRWRIKKLRWPMGKASNKSKHIKYGIWDKTKYLGIHISLIIHVALFNIFFFSFLIL